MKEVRRNSMKKFHNRTPLSSPKTRKYRNAQNHKNIPPFAVMNQVDYYTQKEAFGSFGLASMMMTFWIAVGLSMWYFQ